MANLEKMTYAQALKELEEIIQEIESETVDVDCLTEKVKRASFLIKWCKNRLRKTETEVKKVLTELPEKAAPETTQE